MKLRARGWLADADGSVEQPHQLSDFASAMVPFRNKGERR